MFFLNIHIYNYIIIYLFNQYFYSITSMLHVALL